MINESYYWKQPLLESAVRLTKLQKVTEINEETYVFLEKDIFISFYAIRKLLDTLKVTNSLKIKKYSIFWHPYVGDKVTWRNNHKIDELYDLARINTEQRDLWFIASRLIHSFIFTVCLNENGGFDGVIFTSDTDKDKKLYILSATEIINIYREVGNNEVTKLSWTKDPETGTETTICS